MNYSKIFHVLFVIILFVFGLSNCSDDNGPIKIGVLLPLTGSQANFGEMEKNSYEMVKEKINSEGGINGRQLLFVYEDDTGKPDIGRTGAEKLINIDKVPLITGGYSSSVTFAACAVAQQYRTPFLVNTGSVDKITQPSEFNLTENDGDKFYIYRLNPPVSEYTSGLESLLSEVVKPASVFILHENTSFGSEGAESFKNICEKNNVKILDVKSYSAGAIDFKPLLQNAKNTKPDIVYMISYVMDAALLMKQSREIGFMPKLFVGAGAGYTMPAFKENAGIASEMVLSVTLWHQTLPIEGALEYYNDYIKKYGGEGPDYHGAEAYAAAQVVVDVLKRCNNDYTPEKIKSTLDKTDINTVFGHVKFSSYNGKLHQNKMNTYVVQWIDGQLKLVWPENLSNAVFSYPIDWNQVWK
ncbi:MAG: ABC transporter substrate-binding protein [Bacteroidetes bacterium]|nr:ABC transporter substrate-binding protein [Bacteroidota bacterium]